MSGKRGEAVIKSFVFFLVLLVFFGISSFFKFQRAEAESAEGVPEKPSLSPALLGKGKALYEKQCAPCHGPSGAGDGAAAYLLYPKPRDLTRGEFRLISTSEMEATDEDLFKTLSRGMPGSAMPSWEFIPEEGRWGLVYYLRYLANLSEKKRAGEITEESRLKGLPWEIEEKLAQSGVDPVQVVQVPDETPVTEETITRGRQLFIQACASCHGTEGKGDGQMKMADSLGYPVRPRDLTAGIFKGNFDFENLYYRIAAGLPGSPMPGYREALTSDQIQDLIHYIQTLPEPGSEERSRVRRLKIVAGRVGQLPESDPLANEWFEREPVFIPLMPLWWRNERVEGVEVRALHDGKNLAVHLSWDDPTEEASMTAVQSFSDGVAIQLSNETDPPLFAMGRPGESVTIWHWKASWQKETENWEDIDTVYPHTAVDFYESQTDYEHGSPFETGRSKTKSHDPLFMTGQGAKNPLSGPERSSAAEKARAEGIGTLTSFPKASTDLEVKGVYREGRWQVVFFHPFESLEGGKIFEAGGTASLAFAVWDGAHRDRDGQKMVSIWNELKLES